MEEIQAANTDTGADTQTQSAEIAGNQDAAIVGADTLGTPAEGGDNAITTEGQESIIATEGRQPHQVPFAERVQQVVEKRLAEMEQKLQAQQAQQPPPFAPEQQVYQLQEMITGAILRENEMLQNLSLEDDPTVKAQLAGELRQIRKWLPKAEAALEKDGQTRQQWQKQQQAQAENQQKITALNAQMESAQAFYRQEMNIPQPVWDAARDFFMNERKTSPLLNQRYVQIWERSGEIAALDFAREHCEKNMGKKQQNVIQQKEELKNQIPQGKTSTGAGNTVDLDALRTKAQRSGSTEDLAAYSVAKQRMHAA